MKAKITYRIRHLVSKFKSLTTAKQILILTFLFSAVFSWLIGALFCFLFPGFVFLPGIVYRLPVSRGLFGRFPLLYVPAEASGDV